MSGKLESTAVARNTKKNIEGVLFTADLSEWNLGATRTTLNNSRANLLSSLCGNVAPAAGQHPLGYPALLSCETSFCGDACQGNIAQICLFPSFSLSPSHSCCGLTSLLTRSKIDPDIQLMSPPGTPHHREGAARRPGSRSCKSRRCYFPRDVPLTSKLMWPRCCLCPSASRYRGHQAAFEPQTSGVQVIRANHSAKGISS